MNRLHSHLSKQNGFTLIEVISVLVLVGLFTAGIGMGAAAITKGYIYAAKNAQTAQKVNIAMKRMTLEFQQLTSVSSSSASALTFVSALGTRTIGFDSDTIKLAEDTTPLADGDILMDEVVSLSLSYINGSGGTWQITDSIRDLTGITIQLEVQRDDIDAGSMTFSTTVYLRSNQNAGGTI